MDPHRAGRPHDNYLYPAELESGPSKFIVILLVYFYYLRIYWTPTPSANKWQIFPIENSDLGPVWGISKNGMRTCDECALSSELQATLSRYTATLYCHATLPCYTVTLHGHVTLSHYGALLPSLCSSPQLELDIPCCVSLHTLSFCLIFTSGGQLLMWARLQFVKLLFKLHVLWTALSTFYNFAKTPSSLPSTTGLCLW